MRQSRVSPFFVANSPRDKRAREETSREGEARARCVDLTDKQPAAVSFHQRHAAVLVDAAGFRQSRLSPFGFTNETGRSPTSTNDTEGHLSTAAHTERTQAHLNAAALGFVSWFVEPGDAPHTEQTQGRGNTADFGFVVWFVEPGDARSRSRGLDLAVRVGRPRRGPGCRAEMPGWSRLS